MDLDKKNLPCYLIKGGTPLRGEVPLSGAKNAVTKMIVASLLTTESCLLRNVPLIGDLELALALCRDLRSQLHLEDHTLSIATPSINSSVEPTELCSRHR